MTEPKIWFDVSHILNWRGSLTGIERVEFHLIQYYYDQPSTEFIVWKGKRKFFRVVDRKYIKKAIIDRASDQEQNHKPILPTRNIARRAYRKLKKPRVQLSNLPLTSGAFIIPAGLWDNPSYIEGLNKAAKNQQIIHVVHDMIPIMQKGYIVEYVSRFFTKYMLSVLPICTGILTVSKSTAVDTEHVLSSNGLKVPKILSFRNGDDITRATEMIRPKKVPEKFILSVGTIEARKNHQLLYYAQKQLLQENAEAIPIVIVGKNGWLSADFQHIAKYDEDTKNKLIILSRVTDSELSWLYKNCLFTIFPSLYEGWGLPVAESLSHGKVTLASNLSSMPEVGGDAADYFSPYSPDQLIKLIKKFSNDKTRHEREKQIKTLHKPLSWDLAAREFDSLAQKLVCQ